MMGFLPRYILRCLGVLAFLLNFTGSLFAEVNASVGRAYNHTLLLKTDGSLWGAGRGFQGQLGISSLSKPTSFVQALEEGVKSISSLGDNSSLFIKSDDTLWGMGLNSYGELGDGTTTQRNLPIQIWSSPVAKAAKSHHIFFSRPTGLCGMGRNKYGQLGDGTNTDRSSPIIIFPSGVADFAVGGHHSLVLKTDGTLWAFGRNGTGQLGDGSTTNRSTPADSHN